ncbi:MAG: DUF1003 domain-containing protein [Hyphomicrobiales bacterium]|nr:MAG: DUF1003 domain-containing protein [Hyphomicrobiales bacterium]
MSTAICSITHQELPQDELIPFSLIRPKVARLIKREHPNLTDESLISIGELNRYRAEYVRRVLEDEVGEVTSLEDEVVRSMKEHELLSDNIDVSFQTKLTFGERLADKIATFGGSWTFIISFGFFLGLWIVLNTLILRNGPPDPYPFILLNLLLSALASLQAPVIMMSQNRQEAKDRLRGEHDYKINLKAELEIRHLHEKLDHLLNHQSQRLFEIQQIQLELMEELVARRATDRPPTQG